MNWDRIGKRWKQLKGKVFIRGVGQTGDAGNRDDLIGATASSRDNGGNAQPIASRVKDHYQRSAFSQHIGC